MPGRSAADHLKMTIDSIDRLSLLETKAATDHERISVLEKHASNMSGLPGRVDALGAKVEALDKSIIREVDGLREQQKAHKTDTTEKMEQGFAAIALKQDQGITAVALKQEQGLTAVALKQEQGFTAMGLKVDAIVARETKFKNWWDLLRLVGTVLVSVAVIVEGFSIFLKH